MHTANLGSVPAPHMVPYEPPGVMPREPRGAVN